eukprot:13245224-Ditylum_brightwellii.AAC.1
MPTIEIRRWIKGNKTFITNCIKIHKAQQRGQYRHPNPKDKSRGKITRKSNKGGRTPVRDNTIEEEQKDQKKRQKEQDIRSCLLKWDSNTIRDDNR